MSSVVLTSLLIAFAASDVPPRWGMYGEYPCVNKSVTVGGYVAGGFQTAILLYPKAAIANKTTLPFVAFAHGETQIQIDIHIRLADALTPGVRECAAGGVLLRIHRSGAYVVSARVLREVLRGCDDHDDHHVGQEGRHRPRLGIG